jgi:LAS superfamily LD-carboxypeptidase LdcB
MGSLSLNSGGRTYAEQQKLYNAYLQGRGNRAAKPGSSLHESGIAADFGGPVYNTNMAAAMATKQHTWLRQNAAQFKWYWVGKNYGESWHWEYHPEWN